MGKIDRSHSFKKCDLLQYSSLTFLVTILERWINYYRPNF